MDRLVRARVLVAEVEALGLSVDDLVAAAAGAGPERSFGVAGGQAPELFEPEELGEGVGGVGGGAGWWSRP